METEEELREEYRDILAKMWIEVMPDMTNVEENLKIMTSGNKEVIITSISNWKLETNNK